MLAGRGEGRRQDTNTELNGATVVARHRTGPSIGHPVSNWNTRDNYMELINFAMKVMNVFITRHYDISDTERVPIIKMTRKERLHFYKDS